MAHELTKPSAAGTPPSSAHGFVHGCTYFAGGQESGARVYSEFCKFMCHKLSEPNKNNKLGVLSLMTFVLWGSSSVQPPV